MNGETVAGAMTFEFFSPGMSAILANSGCRFVFYDMEHTGLGFETLKWLSPPVAACRSSRWCGCPAAARTTARRYTEPSALHHRVREAAPTSRAH